MAFFNCKGVLLAACFLTACSPHLRSHAFKGAEDAAQWKLEYTADNCYAEGCFFALLFDIVFVPVVMVFGALDGLASHQEIPRVGVPEGLQPDRENVRYVPSINN